MKFITRPWVFTLLLIPLLLAVPDARAQDNLRGEPPDWVIPQSLPSDTDGDPATLVGGIQYLLIDRQTNIPTQQSFIHFAFRVTNSDGVQSMSDISASFDPSYQELQFHMVRLHRDGRIIDNLSDHKIQKFRRESRMDRNLYDGSETTVINQRNVHIGDIIEYAYTITGFNPIHEDNFFDLQYFQYGLAIDRIYIRLIADPDRPLHFRYLDGAPQVTRTLRDSLVEFTWDVADTPAYLTDDYAPLWFDPYPRVWISSFDTWSQVVDWALPHYEVAPSDAAAMGTLASEIAPAEKMEERILQTIRFVQDEVRYLGMEQGLGAYRPNQPLGVFERRFGDCKDKSLLLSALLRNLGVEADPVLVSFLMKGHLDTDAPSPLAFDHCIVRYRYVDRDRFVDPTWSNQGGDLEHMSDPSYGLGLVIADGITELVEIPAPATQKTEITYKFTIEEVGSPALLEVRTVYAGSEANRHRDWVLNSSVDEISRDNLDYYSYAFPGIRQVQPTRYIDEGRDGDNLLIAEESYRIEDFWKSTPDDSLDFYAELMPLEISQVTDLPPSADRSAPLYLGPPLDITLNMEVKMPDDWPVKADKVEIKGDAFAYHSEIKNQGDLIQISYRYQRFQESIAPEETARFFADHERIQEDQMIFLTHNLGLESYQFSGFASALAAAALLLGFFLARRVHYGFDPAGSDEQRSPLPLGSWLALLVPGFLLTIGRHLFDLVSVYLNHNTWLAILLDDGFSSFSMLGTMLTVELLGNTLFLVFSSLLLLQVVQKRSSFPRLMVIYLVSYTVFAFLDSLGARLLIADSFGQDDSGEEFFILIINIIQIAIWAPYLMKGRRPRHTFVNRLNQIDRPQEVEVEIPDVPEPEVQDSYAPPRRVAPLDDELPENIHGQPDLCFQQVLGLFRRIAEEFPGYQMTILDQDPATPAALTIVEQAGIPRRIVLDLQKENVLNLTIGPVWLTWSPCDKPAVREEFFNTVSGLLSGCYRLVEYRRNSDLVLARIQKFQGQKWVKVHQWSRDRWTSTRGLQEEIVAMGGPGGPV